MLKKFPTELKNWKYFIERTAKKAGLDFFNTIFEIVNFDEMNEIAAYSGFPTRRSHWLFGQEYEEHRKFYGYGLMKIYEMVINNDPAVAYLLENNTLTDHKIVMAHVYGHVDFMKNNIWFLATPRKMLNELANHRYQIEAIKEKIGEEKVDDFLDKLISIEWLIDEHSLMIKASRQDEEDDIGEEIMKFRVKDLPDYMERWLNPLEYSKEQENLLEKAKEEKAKIEKGLKIPVKPSRDILLFFIEHAPLEYWQKELISIIREENYYFAPQAQTKIMNEGWATFWHEEILVKMGVLEGCEIIGFASHGAGTLTGFPYKLGYEIFKDIEYRWDTGRHGKIYEMCDKQEILDNWDDFIIFKSFYDECRKEKNCSIISAANMGNEVQEKWNEFCAFKEILKNGEFGFPKELWLIGQPVKYWHEYLNAEEILKDCSRLLEPAKKLWREAIEFLKKIETEPVPEKKIKLRERYEIKAGLAKWDISAIEREKRFIGILLKIKKIIKEQKDRKTLIFKNIPEIFFDWARRYLESIKLYQGREMIFEVRKHYNDLTFIAEFFTKEICEKLQLYTYEPGGGGAPLTHWGIASKEYEDVKKRLLFMITHRGQPIIELIDANYENGGELYLKHLYEGMDMRIDLMKYVLKIIYEIWQKPVHLETVSSRRAEDTSFGWLPYFPVRKRKSEYTGERKIWTYDGTNFKEKKIGTLKVVKRPF